MAGATVEATDSMTNASLLDPAYGIPFDIHFEIVDNAGNTLGKLGGHKNIMALKSPVFKAMLFGPMKETDDPIKIKNTSVFAFKTIQNYIHGVEEEWWPWSIEVSELVRIADLAERFNLAGLKEKTIQHANEVFLFPKESLLEIARIAEESHVYTNLSETLLENCTHLLYAIIETPEDYNELFTEWSKKSPEEASIALRLQARPDQKKISYNVNTSPQGRKIISHLRNLARSIKPRYRLQKIKKALEDSNGQSKLVLMDVIDDYEGSTRGDDDEMGGTRGDDDEMGILLRSFWICQKVDASKAALKGIPLKLDTLVEENFTHEMSVKLHLDLITLTTNEGHKWNKVLIDSLWKELMRAIPEAKPMILSWFAENDDLIGTEASSHLAKKLISCDDELLRGLPEYVNAIDVFPNTLQFS